MTCKLYAQLMAAADKSDDRDAYISEWSMSDVFGARVPGDVEWMERVDALGRMWDAAHLTIKRIRAASGLTQAAFANRIVASVRTVEAWEYRHSKCPLFVRLILAERFGLYQPPDLE